MEKIETTKWFTQANLSEGEERIFSQCIYLSKYDKAENWVEWTTRKMNNYLNSLAESDC